MREKGQKSLFYLRSGLWARKEETPLGKSRGCIEGMPPPCPGTWTWAGKDLAEPEEGRDRVLGCLPRSQLPPAALAMPRFYGSFLPGALPAPQHLSGW